MNMFSYIKKADVVRDSCGFWTHPDLPDFGESVSFKKFSDQAGKNDGGIIVHSLEDTDTKAYGDMLESGNGDCSKWMPTCNLEPIGAFLLSIHDTEDGPHAWFFCPFKS